VVATYLHTCGTFTKVSELCLEDFQSRQAWVHHTKYSPVGGLKVRKTGRGRQMYKHQPRWAEGEASESE
jgi:hypothetical protein